MVGMLTLFSLSKRSHPSASRGSLPGVMLRVASMPKAYLMRVKRLTIISTMRRKPMMRLHRARRKMLSVLAHT